MGALDFNNKDKDTEKYIHWKEVESNSGLRVNQAQIVKAKDDPPFSVALGAQVFSSGQHEFDFGITRHSDGYVYVGVAVPTLATDQTFCRKSANDQVWYYFGCGYTNALRNGYKDVVSKEVGGAEQKIPKLQPGDRIRLALDMDAGTLKFSIFRLEDPSWKELPGQIDGISQPVVAACCIQERGDAVTLSDSARMVVTQEAEGAMKKRVNKYAHIQSKLKEAGSLRHMIPQNEGGGENEDKENPNPEVTRKEKSKFRHFTINPLNPKPCAAFQAPWRSTAIHPLALSPSQALTPTAHGHSSKLSIFHLDPKPSNPEQTPNPVS